MSVSDYSHNHMFLLSRLVISARFPVPHVYTEYSMSHLFENYPKSEGRMHFYLFFAANRTSRTQKMPQHFAAAFPGLVIPPFRDPCRIRDKLP